MLKNQRKDTYQSPSQSSQKMAVDDPLLKVPPARRGNRTRARFPSRSGGNLRLKGVGFFSRGWNGGRDARVPSVARAGSASVSLAW